MKVSFYTTAFNLTKSGTGFNVPDALANWFHYADEVSVAVPAWDDESAAVVAGTAQGRNVSIVRPSFTTDDPLFYGRTLNAALQNCTGDFIIIQDLDERFRVRRDRLEELHHVLQTRWDVSAFFIPTVDLYGSYKRCLPRVNGKWFCHRFGIFRGPANGTMKPDGHPDYNHTSTDEAVDIIGNLVPTVHLLPDRTLENLRPYVAAGWPVSYHVGYCDFGERITRSLWWKSFWVAATNGDPNQHPTSIEELAAKETVEHGLPLWPPLEEIT